MKLKNFFLALGVAAMTFVGCDQVGELVGGGKLDIPETEFTEVPAEGQTLEVTFTAPVAWAAEVTEGEEWISLEVASGEGAAEAQTLTVTVDPNETEEERTGTVLISMGELSQPVTITQAGKEAQQPEQPEDPEVPSDSTATDPTVALISSVLALETDAVIPEGTVVEAVVISNRALNNVTSKKALFVQDATGGLQLRAAADHEYDFGDSLRIDLSGLVKGVYNKALQITLSADTPIEVLSKGATVEAKEVTVEDFLANKYEGQYVAVPGVQVASSDLDKTFVVDNVHTSINMVASSGEKFLLFSSRFATNGAEAVPQGSGVLKGISTKNYDDIQITLTDVSDYAGLTGERFGQEEPEQPGDSTVVLDAIYFNDFDKEVATKAYGSGSSWPYLDQFEGWKNENGLGAEDVSYVFKGTSVRSNSTSDSNVSDYAGSGDNNIFFGSSAHFAVKNILLGDASNLSLTFGTEKYSSTAGSIFTNSEYHIWVAGEEDKWVELKDYTFAGGTTEGRWNVATANFTVPSGTKVLSVCFVVDVASAYRMDDLKLEASEVGGSAVDFSAGVTFEQALEGGVSEEPVVPLDTLKATVAEFLAASVNADQWYELTGKVSNISNTTYGNFDLVDETGTVYVYGLTATKVAKNDKSFASLDLKEGDVVTLYGTRAEYKSEAQVGGPAYYKSHTAAPEEPELVASEWGVVGTLNGWAEPDVVMYEVDGMYVAYNVVFDQEDNMFKIRANNEWNDAKNYGLAAAGNVVSDHYYSVVTGGGSGNMSIAAGTYDIWFDYANETVYVMTPGKSVSDAVSGTPEVVVSDAWYVVGSFNNWTAGDENYKMIVEDGWYAFEGLELPEGGEIKFNDGTWNDDRGGVYVESGAEFAANKGGQNIILPAGDYVLFLSTDLTTIKIFKGEEKPLLPLALIDSKQWAIEMAPGTDYIFDFGKHTPGMIVMGMSMMDESGAMGYYAGYPMFGYEVVPTDATSGKVVLYPDNDMDGVPDGVVGGEFAYRNLTETSVEMEGTYLVGAPDYFTFKYLDVVLAPME